MGIRRTHTRLAFQRFVIKLSCLLEKLGVQLHTCSVTRPPRPPMKLATLGSQRNVSFETIQ